MSAPALWTKHRPLACTICRRYHVPGLDADDLEQEAMIALWLCARSFDPSKGSFKSFAGVVIERRLTSLLRAATRTCRYATMVREVDVAAPDTSDASEARETLARISTVPLTALERKALSDAVNGVRQTRQTDNAAWRARRKLRAAL